MVLASGGIDSAACIHILQSRGIVVSTLFVNFGQPARVQEQKAIARLSKWFGVRLTNVRVSSPGTFIPGEIVGRNAFLVFCALMFCRPNFGQIALGIHAGTPYFDCSKAFFDVTSRSVQDHTNGQIHLAAPFLTWSKAEIVYYFQHHDLPIHLTYSCERGGRLPCGRCLSCRDREALGVT